MGWSWWEGVHYDLIWPTSAKFNVQVANEGKARSKVQSGLNLHISDHGLDCDRALNLQHSWMAGRRRRPIWHAVFARSESDKAFCCICSQRRAFDISFSFCIESCLCRRAYEGSVVWPRWDRQCSANKRTRRRWKSQSQHDMGLQKLQTHHQIRLLQDDFQL